jgi:hypothetical protein
MQFQANAWWFRGGQTTTVSILNFGHIPASQPEGSKQQEGVVYLFMVVICVSARCITMAGCKKNLRHVCHAPTGIEPTSQGSDLKFISQILIAKSSIYNLAESRKHPRHTTLMTPENPIFFCRITRSIVCALHTQPCMLPKIPEMYVTSSCLEGP